MRAENGSTRTESRVDCPGVNSSIFGNYIFLLKPDERTHLLMEVNEQYVCQHVHAL